MKEKKVSKYDWAMNELADAKELVDTCSKFYKKFPKHLTKDINFTDEDLSNFIKKIEVREQIIKIRQNNEILSKDEKESLKKLHEEYRKSNYFEKDDLTELSSIIGVDLYEDEKKEI